MGGSVAGIVGSGQLLDVVSCTDAQCAGEVLQLGRISPLQCIFHRRVGENRAGNIGKNAAKADRQKQLRLILLSVRQE